ncbi:MAG: polyphosphate kinase 1 [Treponema sp.]|jgi:polyphosphate kinase|nr:polyphosphate kinase 1 [Treponema sp.]
MQHYFNRDLSWIDFNERVLGEGLRQDQPPLERFRYLSIVASNFEEFFMIRIAALKARIRRGATDSATGDASQLSPEAQFRQSAEKVRSIFRRQYECLENEVFPALARSGLELARPDSYTKAERDYLESLFMREIFPLLMPQRVADAEFPAIENGNLYTVFLLSPSLTDETISIVPIPPILSRIIWLPDARAGKTRWALLEDMVLLWGDRCFPGYTVCERLLFKINRDAHIPVDERRDEDFIEAMEEVLENREHSRVVRMVYASGSTRLRDTLARRFELGPYDLYEVNSPPNLGTLYELADAHGFAHLREASWKIHANPAFAEGQNFWERISLSDVLLHLPYESFDPVLRFFHEAAADPDVLAIKATLYRTSGDSPIVRALEQAALAGKQVMVVVELKARFDEERNISWAKGLEKAGVVVIYGLARLKVHAKLAIVMRREHDRVKRYVHLSTGNYNDRTARLYEDLGLFTARDEIAFDAGLLFNMISGYSVIQATRCLVIAPTMLKRRLLELIDREARRSTQEYPGRIMAKMNALVDTDIIDALYRASCAGVRIELCIRGICMLVPGVPALSERIRVISVIDHYLEHSRIMYFANGGSEELYLASADWMPRNLERRVELMFPLLQDDLKRRVFAILEAYFVDNTHARELTGDGLWRPCESAAPAFRVQTALLARTRDNAERPLSLRGEFTVRRSQP